MATRGLSADEIKRRAQLTFDKAEQRKLDSERAFDALRAEQQATAAKTARLRALRLAKESADAEAAAQVAAEQLAAKAAKLAAKLAAAKTAAANKTAAAKTRAGKTAGTGKVRAAAAAPKKAKTA